MNILFSIIIPIYQSKKYLHRCIESVLAQETRDYEIILIDDGSTDGSEIICDEYSTKYDNISCIHQKNQGVSCARNVGIKNAKGDYLIFLDSDDFISTDYLTEATNILGSYNVDMILSGYQNVIKGGKITREKYFPLVSEGIWKASYYYKIVLTLFESSVLHAIGTKIYRRSVLIDNQIMFMEQWDYYEDIYFCLQFLYKSEDIYVCNKINYFYQRDIKDSLSKRAVKINYQSIQYTYHLLAKFIRGKRIKTDRLFELYMARINILLDNIAASECRYNSKVRNIYIQISHDKLFQQAIIKLKMKNNIEYLLLMKRCYFLVYLIRRLQL